jgi:hypothetical protein
LIPTIAAGQSTYQVNERMLTVSWPTKERTALVMQANLSDAPATLASSSPTKILFSTHRAAATDHQLDAWEVRLLLSSS